jgi:hypothetical protein
MSGRERDDPFPMGERERPHTGEERASAALVERREGARRQGSTLRTRRDAVVELIA